MHFRFKSALHKFNNEFFYIFGLVITATLTFFPFALYGFSLSDTSQIFHFGNRVLQGEFPYRDFEYQTGFLGLYLDAEFQYIFGEVYLSSIYYRFALKVAYIISVYFIFRSKATKPTAFILAAILCLYGLDGQGFFFPHLEGGNMNLALLFAVLFWVCLTKGLESFNSNKTGKSAFTIILSGVFLSLIFGARQSTGITCLVTVLGTSLFLSLCYFKTDFKKIFAFLLIGTLLGLGLQLFFLAINGSLFIGLNSLLFEAASKKDIQTHIAILDALSGGTDFTKIKQILTFQVIPGFIALGYLFIINYCINSNKNKYVSALLSIPFLLCLFGLVPAAYGYRILDYDFPRILFSLLLVFGCLFPKSFEQKLGVVNPHFALTIALFISIVWSQQISWPGRPYTAEFSLLILSTALVAFSSKIMIKFKQCISFFGLLFMIVVFTLGVVSNSVGSEKYILNYYREINNPSEHPILKSIKLPPAKVEIISKLDDNIQPGDICFISGSASVLYTILDCQNPTRLDITNADSITTQYVEQTLSKLNSNPPLWLIDTGRFGGIATPDYENIPFNLENVKKLQQGLNHLLTQYQLVESGSNLLVKPTPEHRSHDKVEKYNLYKYKG